jgi:hypothetical protein
VKSDVFHDGDFVSKIDAQQEPLIGLKTNKNKQGGVDTFLHFPDYTLTIIEFDSLIEREQNKHKNNDIWALNHRDIARY